VLIATLHWDDDGNNVQHLWQAHQVTPDEVEEIIFGIDGEDASYRMRREGAGYLIFGETGGGRLLKMYGEFVHDGCFRVYAAQDMNEIEKRKYRKGK
jgi:hypothetical protein